MYQARLRDWLISAALCFAIPAALPSQVTRNASSKVAVGDQVRVLAPSLGSQPRSGTLTALTSELLSLTESTTGATWVIPANQVMRLDVRAMNSATNAGKGALIGAATGFVVLGVGGYVLTRCPRNCTNEYANGLGGLLAIPGGGAGAIVGALIGRSQGRAVWQRVELPLKVSLVPTGNRQFRMSGSFIF